MGKGTFTIDDPSSGAAVERGFASIEPSPNEPAAKAAADLAGALEGIALQRARLDRQEQDSRASAALAATRSKE